ncbi:MAG TPA: redoxin domain-containing protein, partial [Candidatus Dormibacteraeota bacterium]|nr:redoxin domain-containing protein [Candidatus Dormibacteraeota bacterium]
PEFTGIQGWVNSSPLTIAGLRGSVVLVDFWTFSCVNCTRTFPHIHALVDTYGHAGLVVVGVHSPEFDFEKDPANVRAAVQRLGVTWPVALDPDMETWGAWGNQYWPAEYLVDRQGRVAYANFGEGAYDETAAAVASLVGTSATPSAMPSSVAAQAPTAGTTPELYAGSEAATQHGDPGLGDGEQYGAPGTVVDYPASAAPAKQRDHIELGGPWTDRAQYVVSGGAGHIRLRFHARDVYVVAGSDGGSPVTLTVALDGAPVPAAQAGAALGPAGASFSVGPDDLYNVLRQVGGGDHVIDIAVPQGLRLYTFTFG